MLMSKSVAREMNNKKCEMCGHKRQHEAGMCLSGFCECGGLKIRKRSKPVKKSVVTNPVYLFVK
jgi:hypothetical protein